jgi:hypothetical protein
MSLNKSPSVPQKSLRQRWRRVLKALAWGGSFAFTLLALVWALEDWCGARAWQAYLEKVKGSWIEPAKLIPPPVPDEQNFAAIPLLQPLADYTKPPLPSDSTKSYSSKVYRNPEVVERLMKIGEIQTKKGGAISLHANGNWCAGRSCDMAELQKQYRQYEEFGLSGPPVKPAEEVLKVLSRYDSHLEALRAGAARPFTRFPLRAVDLEDQVFGGHSYQTVFLKSCWVLKLRALAELSLGKSQEAGADLLLYLRLTEAMEGAQPVFLLSLMMRSTLELESAQVIWEGIGRHQWSETQLAAFAGALDRVDLPSDYPVALRTEQTIIAFLIDQMKDNPRLITTLTGSSRGPLGVFPVRLIPKGWFDFNKTAICERWERTRLATDPAHRPSNRDGIDQNRSQSNKGFFRGLYEKIQFGLLPMREGDGGYREYLKDTQAVVDLERVAIALERHRIAKGNYPVALKELVPAYLAKVPTDLSTGEPLFYQRNSGNQFTLRSVPQNANGEVGWAHEWKSGFNPQ